MKQISASLMTNNENDIWLLNMKTQLWGTWKLETRYASGTGCDDEEAVENVLVRGKMVADKVIWL